MEKFWLVWRPNGLTPTVRYGSYKEAEAMTRRLARENEGHAFYVLEAVSYSKSLETPVNTTFLTPPSAVDPRD
jgi:hypothetical protein